MDYIKTYSYSFLKSFNDVKTKFKDNKKIIDIKYIYNTIHKMISIYIYKIFYINFQIDSLKIKKILQNIN